MIERKLIKYLRYNEFPIEDLQLILHIFKEDKRKIKEIYTTIDADNGEKTLVVEHTSYP